MAIDSSSLRFLITAGPTREWIDPVRFISNRSSGKMGYALAEAARAVSSRVTLVSGPVVLTPPAGVEVVNVTTAQEMADATLSRFANSDVVIMAAAVCDFRPRQAAALKIKKETFDGVLELEGTMDILAELGRRKSSQVLVGFAMETNDLDRNAREKLARKHLDMIVANDARGFEGDTNMVALLKADGTSEQLPEMSKREVAAAIVKHAVASVP